jgi:hypothetical protein
MWYNINNGYENPNIMSGKKFCLDYDKEEEGEKNEIM